MSPSDNSKIALVVVCVSCSTLLLCFDGVHGVVMISPSPRAAVCRVGDHLEVMCNATGSIVDWNIAFEGINDRVDSTVTSNTQVQDILPLHSTVFIFSRTSERGMLPLISILEITSVTNSLNGSTISCMDSSSAAVETTVYIIGDSDAYLPNVDAPVVSTEEQFGMDSVVILLQWRRELQNSLISYLISVVPMADVATDRGSNGANVTVLYNSLYKISVVADLCGRINDTTMIRVYYVNCGDPLKQRSNNNDADSVTALGYSIPALEGSSVDLKCPPGLTLIGPNASICMGNGEWEPDIGQIECHGSSNEPLSREGKIAIASSVTVFALASIVFFTVGFLCGHFCQKKRKSNTSPAAAESVLPVARGGEQTQIPYYDDMVLQQEVVELKDNVAYGPIQ